MGVSWGRPGSTILVVGSDDESIAAGIARVEALGHRAATCHLPGEPCFPCNAFVEGRRCPVDDGIDATLNVRTAAQPTVAPAEMGALCALRAGAPIVIAGAREPNPFAGLSGVEIDGTIATAVEVGIHAADDLRRW